MSDPPEYLLVTKDGKKKILGLSKNLIHKGQFRERYFELTNRQIKEVKAPVWQNVVNVFGKLLDLPENQIDLGPEATESGSVRESIDLYFTYNKPHDSLTESTLRHDLPWRDEHGNIYLRNFALRAFLHRRIGVQYTQNRITKLLNEAGLDPVRRMLGKTTRRYWMLPADTGEVSG